MFISDLRNCSSKEQEHKRVHKELAKIRLKFGNTKKTMSAYDKKKYVWKLLYIQMLGYLVDFGQMESINLICSSKYSEKYTGYIAAALLLNEHSE
jgi:AP-2 complex subunit alpha